MTIKQIHQNYPQAVMAVVGAVVLLGSAVGGFLFLDSRYARAEQSVKTMVMMQQSIQSTNVKIDMHTMAQRIDQLEAQMWKIEDRHDTQDPMAMPVNDRERYRRLKKQRDTLERQLAVMEANIPKAPTNPHIVE
jgi:uncharacterized protein involved in exopolysaccharide biosynthesis